MRKMLSDRVTDSSDLPGRPITLVVLFCSLFLSINASSSGESIRTVDALVRAVHDALPGTRIQIAEGTYLLDRPLLLKTGVTLKGAGLDKTIISHTRRWEPSTKTLPDPETKMKGLDADAYLLRLENKAMDITISDMTLLGPQVHGAIFGFGNDGLHLHHLKIQDTKWAGIRTIAMQRANIHDCVLVDAGGRWQRGGVPGVSGGITGGGIFATWMKDSTIAHNRFVRTQAGKEHSFFGIKVRQGKRSRVHHNTINVNFSIEFPFENDQDVEIDHNVCSGTVSIPKHAGGPVPESGSTFHIHHNYFLDSYAIEFVRNGVEIDHNVFEFSTDKDHGNLISGFGKSIAEGPAIFHNNVVKNPGRGVVWINSPYSNLTIRNNRITANTTLTTRKSGLFGLNTESDFTTISIRDNVIECIGQPRPLLRNDESAFANIENNRLVNVSDMERYENPPTENAVGLTAPLSFTCGVQNETRIDDGEVVSVAAKSPDAN